MSDLNLTPFDDEKPWLVSLVEGIRESLFPPKQPPLAVTSKPLTAQEMGRGSMVTAPTRSEGAFHSERFRTGVVEGDGAHLNRLAHTGEAESGWAVLGQNIREMFFPPKQAPLQVTSKPVQVKSIWGFSGGHSSNAALITSGIHVGVIALLFLIGGSYIVSQEPKDTVTLVEPIDLAPYLATPAPEPEKMGGGGGGGSSSPIPASKGKLPPQSYEQFVPPQVEVVNDSPELVMAPSIVVPPSIQLPNVNMKVWGDPSSTQVAGPPSSGTGSGGGIGSGSGGGVGEGKGRGLGPGEGGGFGGGVYKIGGGVSAPTLISKVEPEYSEEARKAKYEGTVVIYVVVDEQGLPRDLKVIRPLGLGLDEKAIEAVRQWKFRPGYLSGKPVPVAATIEVNFRLL